VRGDEKCQEGFIMLTSLEDRIPACHPLRPIRRMVDRALSQMSPLLDALYAERGRVSIPPEYLLRAQLIQILYAIPSERRLCEELEYNLLVRWFVGLPLSQAVWHPTSFSKNRDRLLSSEVAEVFFEYVRGEAESRRLLSREHFSCDGTLLEAAASLKSFRPKEEQTHKGKRRPPRSGGRNPTVDFHGETRSNTTHASTTDPEARLAKKGAGKEAKLAYTGHIQVENRNGLIVSCALTKATGKAEEDAALALLTKERGRRRGRLTVGADRGYHTRRFVEASRALGVTPHVAQKKRYNAIDGRTTGWEGYSISQRRRKIVEESFGWMKTVGGLRKLRHRGEKKVRAIFTFTAGVFNLVRLRNLGAELCPA
jgi:transposase